MRITGYGISVDTKMKELSRPLHESHFTCMLRRLKAPTVGKIVLNRSFISINSLIPCVFALPKSEIIFRAKVSYRL